MDRHQKVTCLVCGKSMRSDVLRRHITTHKDLLSLPEEQVKEELRVRHAVQMEREAKRKRVEEIAEEEGLMVPTEVVAEKTFDKETVRKEMVKENQQYIGKIELGRMIASIIDEKIYIRTIVK